MVAAAGVVGAAGERCVASNAVACEVGTDRAVLRTVQTGVGSVVELAWRALHKRCTLTILKEGGVRTVNCAISLIDQKGWIGSLNAESSLWTTDSA